MSSLRKIRKIASREKERNRVKCRERIEKQKITKKKLAQKEFRKGIRETLGFDKIKIKGLRNPSLDLDWNGVPW